MDFSQALIEMKKGNKVYRYGWNRTDLKVFLYNPDVMINQHFILHSGNMKVCDVWFPSTSDILADDWEVI